MKVIIYTDISNLITDNVMGRVGDLIDESIKYTREIEEENVDFFISEGNFKLLSKWKKEDWDEMQIRNAEVLASFVDTRFEMFRDKIIELCDIKQDAAEFLISGKIVTPPQRERYKVKAKHARNATGRNALELEQQAAVQQNTVADLVTISEGILQPLADSNGMTVAAYSELIVTTEIQWSLALDVFSTLIETIKGRAYDVLDTKDYTKVSAILTAAENIGMSEVELSPQDTIDLARIQVQDIITNYPV